MYGVRTMRRRLRDFARLMQAVRDVVRSVSGIMLALAGLIVAVDIFIQMLRY